MKTYKNLWDSFISKDNFELAYNKAVKKKGRQRQVIAFNQNKEENLEKVRELVANGQFHTSPYKNKTIYEPKERTIYILPFSPDRIVQHAIMNILKPILTSKFMENSYACIEGKGQIKATQKCNEYVRKYKYCLKCDIRKFYPSINQNKLSNMFHRIIKDDKFMEVLDDVIFSFPGGYNCPIGNFLSQWCGNFYLTALDNFVLHKLKCGSYQRYCDDFMLFSNDKKYLHYCKEEIRKFIYDELELTYSKAEVFNVKQGVDFCGYRNFGKYILVRKSTSKKMKRKMRKLEVKILSGNYDLVTTRSKLASASGWIKHSCSYHFRKSMKLDELTEIVKERDKWEKQQMKKCTISTQELTNYEVY